MAINIIRVLLSKLAVEHHLLDVSVAEGKGVIQLYEVADDFGWGRWRGYEILISQLCQE